MTNVERFKRYVVSLNDRGGPIEEDYFELSFLICKYARQGLTRQQILEVFEPLLIGTFIGKMLMVKKHGAFDIIEQMYAQNYCSDVPWQNRWDDFIFQTWTCQAVRERMGFLKRFLIRRPIYSLLDVGCGSGQAFNIVSNYNIHYTGIDHDPEAIVYCKNRFECIGDDTFKTKNILKIGANGRASHTYRGFLHVGYYNCIWSAGVFDYMKDDLFITLIKKLLTFIPEDGYLVIGNLSPRCPEQCIMVLLHWYLFYRSKAHLLKLSENLPIQHAWVESDSMGIQHYLILQK